MEDWRKRRLVAGEGEDQEFDLGHVKFEMLFRYLCGKVKSAVGYAVWQSKRWGLVCAFASYQHTVGTDGTG